MKEIKLEVQKPPALPTSKTTLLNHMILRAWRERWSDSQWSINIKNVLPRGVSGDVYNLADCILQQALVGSTGNPLVLNYLKHSICAHLVSHAAVLRRISKFEEMDRVVCLTSLVEFLNNVLDSITCRNKSEEHLLPGALVALVYWLMQIISSIMKRYELKNEMCAEDSHLLDCAIISMEKTVRNQFLLGILYVGRQEDADSYAKIRDVYSSIKTSLINTSFIFRNPMTETQLHQLAYIDVNHLPMPTTTSGSLMLAENLTYCLQPLLTTNILLNPCNETSFYVTELLMIQRLKHLSTTRLIYEIIRAGLMSISNTDETSQDILWGAFTFFKVPHIITQLHSMNQITKNDTTAPSDYIPEVVDALELLLQDNLLLDSMDSKCACNIIEFLLDDWAKRHLVTEVHVKHFASKREKTSLLLQKRESGSQTTSIINFIRRAEVPLSGILKSLCTDYNKVQEPVLGVLTQVLVGNSFDLILSVATVEGRLKTFVSRLIQCNENSKQVPGEVGKPSVVRSTLFDASFLMLTFIVQTYGSEAVLSENGDSLFEKWVRECMVERNKPKNPRNIVAACDENTVDELLLAVSKPEAQLKNSNITWQDMCMNLPGVLYHVLLAWEKEALTSADVKSILDNIKRRLPCFSVCATAYLCAHMNAVKESEFLKPLNMIQQFLTPPTSEEMSTQENAKECLALAFKIIRKMQHEAHASSHPKARTVKLLPNSVLHGPLSETFKDVWKSIMDYGWLPARVGQILESILNVGGPEWLTKQLVEEILRCKYTSHMLKTMDIVFAVFHMDIESITEALLRHVLPHTLLNRHGNDEINESQSSVLARLCVFCIISCLERQATASATASPTKVLKRSRSQDGEDAEQNANKTRKLNTIDNIKSEITNDTVTTTSATATTTATITVPTAAAVAAITTSTTIVTTAPTSITSTITTTATTPASSSSSAVATAATSTTSATSTTIATTADTVTSTGIGLATTITTTATTTIATPNAVTITNNVSGIASNNVTTTNNTATTTAATTTTTATNNNTTSVTIKTESKTTPPAMLTTNIKLNENLKESLELILQDLFKLFFQFINKDSLSLKAYFVYQFVSLLVEYGKENVRPVLKLFPPNLMQHILKVITTDEVSVGLISRIYDLNTNAGRQTAISDLCLWRNIQLKQEYTQL